jgi:DMSO reductase anchor subunit
MIYACIKFLQEWASPLTVINYTLLGTASGFTLAAAYAAYSADSQSARAGVMATFYTSWAIIITVVALVTRGASLIRNARLRYKSTLQTAIGVRHTRITQRSQGFMGGSFNTREFFHGMSRLLMRATKWLFIVLVFVVPVALMALALAGHQNELLTVAFLVQYTGLLLERWFFFAQANHPQNLYYQTVG